MSNKFKYISGYETLRALPVVSGVVIEVGDNLKLSGGFVEPVAATTDNLVFIGVAKEAHAATSPAADLTVSLANGMSIWESELDAATDITAGDALQLNGEQSLKKSATDAVALAMETKLGATKIRHIFKIPALLIGDAT
jgi:hypothetical protein